MRKLVLVAVLALAGCAGMPQAQKDQYRNLKRLGAADRIVKNPATAAWLNVLPGFGDVYNGQYALGFGNFLLWPFSIVWAVPAGAVTAGQINDRATVDYYLHGDGKGQFDRDAILAPVDVPGSAPEPARNDAGP